MSFAGDSQPLKRRPRKWPMPQVAPAHALMEPVNGALTQTSYIGNLLNADKKNRRV
jgi:hypothetical protein